MEVKCQRCGTSFLPPDGSSGQFTQCPNCLSPVLVPGEHPLPPTPDAENGSPVVASGPGAASSGDADNPYQPPRSSATYHTIDPGPIHTHHRHVPNYLVQAILCTLFCCVPFGIVAIVFAAQVNPKLSAGDYRGATIASANARTWCWASFWCGLAAVVLWFFAVIAGGM